MDHRGRSSLSHDRYTLACVFTLVQHTLPPTASQHTVQGWSTLSKSSLNIYCVAVLRNATFDLLTYTTQPAGLKYTFCSSHSVPAHPPQTNLIICPPIHAHINSRFRVLVSDARHENSNQLRVGCARTSLGRKGRR